ncbi:MAG TPA: HAMP domain-containing sensor histidine kinase, partial [Dehalococcoidia bacterium]|nr:HAMP domain-containing sensor histidine kinase [Dehalococcoidia bacterium]
RINLQLLRRRLGETAEAPNVARALEAIARNVDHLEGRIDDLQQAADIGSGEFSLRLGRCDLAKLARDVIAEQEKTVPGQSHTLALSTPGDLAGEWDRDRVHQALANLVSYALKSSPAGTTVAVTVDRAGDAAVVTVTDQGAGFAPEDRDELFRPLGRRCQEPPVKGTGLELFIVKGIVAAHGGRVWAESAGPGQGSRFGFSLLLTRV